MSALVVRILATAVLPGEYKENGTGGGCTFNEVEDFFDVVGYNTDYVIAAEECMADNFSFAVVPLAEMEYYSPEILQAVLDILAAFN